MNERPCAPHPPPPPHEGVGVGEKPRLALIASVPTTESLPWFRSLDMHYRLDIVAEPAGQDRVLYLLDGETDLDRLGAMLARHPGILWLRALPAAPPHGRPPAIVYAFGGWRAVRKIGREQGSESVDPALIGLLRAARGFIAAPEIIAVLTSEFGSLDGLAATLDEQAPDSADRLRGAIEGFAENHPLVRRDKVVGALAAITVEPGPTAADRANLAIAIREGTPTLKPRQLLVDVTMLSVNDGRTGIERVVRAMLLALIGTVPEHWRVEAVRRQGDGYLYARAFLAGLLGCPEIGLPDDPVDAGGDDVFLDMEFSLAAVQRDAELAERGQGWLLYHRLRGMKVYFAIHDILPVQLPRFFNPEIGRPVRRLAADLTPTGRRSHLRFAHGARRFARLSWRNGRAKAGLFPSRRRYRGQCPQRWNRRGATASFCPDWTVGLTSSWWGRWKAAKATPRCWRRWSGYGAKAPMSD